MSKVVLADDEVTMVQMVTEMLRAEGHEVFPFTTAQATLDAIDQVGPELVITDLYLDRTGPHGMEIVQKARSMSPPAIVIVITGFGTIESAVEAMKRGAYDYLEKPFQLDELRLCVHRALSYNAAVSENLYLRRQLRKKYQFNQIIGASPKMQEVFKMIERVADTDCTILILGESGTGKELVAKALHFNSRRQFAPFIPINCSALPENLLESELFGHRKGSFTGAITDKKGLFQEADGGTMFLDEVGSMSATLQSRLLRVLQEREVRRVGDNASVYINVRVVAASNEPLEQRMKEGSFREDLFYRLNVIQILLPSLRERKEDIPLLVAHFLRQKVHAASGLPFHVPGHVLRVLSAYEWPGNVRELENAIERACALSETNTIRLEDLPPALEETARHLPPSQEPEPDLTIQPQELNIPAGYAVATADGARNSSLPNRAAPLGPLKDFLRDQEVGYIHRALTYTEGDKEKAAELLDVSLATLYRKLADDNRPSA